MRILLLLLTHPPVQESWLDPADQQLSYENLIIIIDPPPCSGELAGPSWPAAELWEPIDQETDVGRPGGRLPGCNSRSPSATRGKFRDSYLVPVYRQIPVYGYSVSVPVPNKVCCGTELSLLSDQLKYQYRYCFFVSEVWRARRSD